MSDPGGSDGDGGPPPEDEPTSRLGARAPWAKKDPAVDDEVKHSALVGFMSVPVHRRFPIRRSTLAMAVAFLGLGTLLYFNAPQSDTASAGTGSIIRTPDGDFVVPGATKVTPVTSTTTTTRPPAPTTTTTLRSSTTTAQGSTTTTTLGNPTTTTTSRGGSGTTTTATTQATTGTGAGGTSRPTTTTTTTGP